MIMKDTRFNKKKIPIFVIAIISAILLNGVFSLISSKLSLPFFLDSIFTVLITVVFGLWPGLITGLLSNFFFEVIKGYPGYLYPFAIVNTLTALVTYLHIRYGDFNKASDALWTIISLSLSNAVVGAIIVSIVFDGITNEPVDSIVRAVVATGQSIFTSAFLGRILINIVDKGIAVLIAFPIYRALYSKQAALSNYKDSTY